MSAWVSNERKEDVKTDSEVSGISGEKSGSCYIRKDGNMNRLGAPL